MLVPPPGSWCPFLGEILDPPLMILFTLHDNFSGATQLSAKLVATHQRKLLSLRRQSHQAKLFRDLVFTNIFLAPHINIGNMVMLSKSI